jgi:hypothetical protein
MKIEFEGDLFVAYTVMDCPIYGIVVPDGTTPGRYRVTMELVESKSRKEFQNKISGLIEAHAIGRGDAVAIYAEGLMDVFDAQTARIEALEAELRRAAGRTETWQSS